METFFTPYQRKNHKNIETDDYCSIMFFAGKNMDKLDEIEQRTIKHTTLYTEELNEDLEFIT